TFLKDKETDKLFKIVKENSHLTIATKLEISRSMTKEDFYNLGETNFEESWKTAIKRAKEYIDEDSLIFITGSLYLIGDVLNGWNTTGK
ncbi:hypothetical protein Q3A91_31225, partial [Nocardia mangyaensis]